MGTVDVTVAWGPSPTPPCQALTLCLSNGGERWGFPGLAAGDHSEPTKTKVFQYLHNQQSCPGEY